MKRLLIFALLFLCVGTAMAQRKKVAVWDAKCIGGDDLLFEADLVQGSLEETVDNMPGYKKYDRAMFDKVMKEHNFERSGAVNDNQIREMGDYAGVDYIFVPSVASKSGYVNIVVRCIDIKLGESKTLQQLSSAAPPEIQKACAKLAERLLGGTSLPGTSPGNSGNATTTQRGQDFTETAFGINMRMIYVEGGTFTMGCTSEQGGECESDESPNRQTTVSSYYIGMLEVTQSQWEKVMGVSISQKWKELKQDDPISFSEPIFKLYGVGPDYPMYYVSQPDAQEFCARLSRQTGRTYRLPYEAEWEYAARGGKKSEGAKYSGGWSIDDVAWYSGNSDSSMHPCGTKRCNALGIYDMSGNMSEWCEDWYGEYLQYDKKNPRGASWGDYPVTRGGNWSDDVKDCRVSSRSMGDICTFIIGFRVVCIP